MKITIKNPKTGKFYYANVGASWVQRHDNGAMISCGLTVGEKYFSAHAFKALEKAGKLIEVSKDEWNHSGCQSGCVRRGDAKCVW